MRGFFDFEVPICGATGFSAEDKRTSGLPQCGQNRALRKCGFLQDGQKF
jgi:hypothetical protein